MLLDLSTRIPRRRQRRTPADGCGDSSLYLISRPAPDGLGGRSLRPNRRGFGLRRTRCEAISQDQA
jgi:hypothetical protein